MIDADTLAEKYAEEIIARRNEQMDEISYNIYMSYARGPLSLLSSPFSALKDNAYNIAIGGEAKGYLEGNVKEYIVKGYEDLQGLRYVAEHGRFLIPGEKGDYIKVKSAKVLPYDEYGNLITDDDKLDMTDELLIELETEDGHKLRVNYFDLVFIFLPNEKTGKTEFYFAPGESYILDQFGEPARFEDGQYAYGLVSSSQRHYDIEIDLRPAGRENRIKYQPYTPIYNPENEEFYWVKPNYSPQDPGMHTLDIEKGKEFRYLKT